MTDQLRLQMTETKGKPSATLPPGPGKPRRVAHVLFATLVLHLSAIVTTGELQASTLLDCGNAPAGAHARSETSGAAPKNQAALQADLQQMQQALARARAANDRGGVVNALVYVALAYEKLGQFEQALEHYQQAWNLLLPTASLGKRAAVLYQIASCHQSLGRYQQSLDYFQQSLALWRQAGNQDAEAQTLVEIGNLHRLLGNPNEAVRHFSQARQLYRSLNQPDEEASALAIMGSVVLNHREMLLYYEEALRIWEGLGNHRNQASMLDAIANFYSDLDAEKALQYLERALTAWQSAGDRAEQAKTLMDIGLTYVWLSDNAKAIQSFRHAQVLWSALNDRRGQAETLTRLGWTYYWADDWQNAVSQFNDAALLWQSVGDRVKAAIALGHLGIIHAQAGRREPALEKLRQVAEVERQLDRLNPAKPTLLYDIGLIHHLTGDGQQALRYWTAEAELYRAREDRQGEASALFTIGQAYEAEGDLARALSYYEQSLDAREKVRSAARIEEFKLRLDENSASAYQRAVLLAVRLRQPARAFALSERARARVFLDQVGNIRPNVRRSGDPALVRREQALLLEIRAIEQQLSAESSRPQAEISAQTIVDLRRQRSAKLREYDDVLTSLKVSDPEYAQLRSVETVGYDEVARLLDAQTTLVSFFVTPGETVAFVLTRDSLDVVELRIGEEELTAAVTELRDFADLDGLPGRLSRLYERLILPLEAHLRTPNIGIVPHSVLHYVPFAALKDGDHYLGEEHTLFTLPSGSTLALAHGRDVARAEGLFAIAQSRAQGLPVLRFANAEAEEVARLYGTTPLMGPRATETAFRSAAGDYGALLVAAHGDLDSTNPLFSQIHLAGDGENDGLLQIHEVYELALARVDLVALSACETQIGRQSKGDDIVALNRAFLWAGASSVVASLWRVDDEATEVLMVEFFTRLQRGESKATALREAQRVTRERFPNPYYWAAFVLTGELP